MSRGDTLAYRYNGEFIKRTSHLNMHRHYGYAYPITIKYHIRTMTYDVSVSLFGTHLLNKTYQAYKLDNFEIWLNSIVDWLVELTENFTKLIAATEKTPPAEPNARSVEFNGHRTGICCYPSLGNIKQAWVALKLAGAHDQWMKVYFKQDELLLDKSIKKLEIVRKQALEPRCWGEKPPSVAPLDISLETEAKTYLTKNTNIILADLNKLPLSKTKFREDYNYDVLIMRRDGDYLIPASANDLASPECDLWTMVIIDYTTSNRSYDGWAKKLGSNQTVMFSKDINHRPFNGRSYMYLRDICQAGVLQSTNQNGYSYIYAYKVSADVSEKDELIEHLLDEAAIKFSERLEAERVKNEPAQQ